jgi:hypothetical protein
MAAPRFVSIAAGGQFSIYRDAGRCWSHQHFSRRSRRRRRRRRRRKEKEKVNENKKENEKEKKKVKEKEKLCAEWLRAVTLAPVALLW